MARGRTFVRGRGSRKSTDWSASVPQTGLVALAGSTALLSQTFIPVAGGETVVRSRGLITFGSDQAAATESQLGAYGIAVVTAQAVSVGITAVLHPATDASWDGWLYHTYLSAHIQVVSASGIMPDMQHQIVVDSKAMRKVSEDDRLVFVIENTVSTGLQFFDSFRILSKLH